MYDTAIPVMWTGSHPGQARRLAIRPTTPAPKERMPRTEHGDDPCDGTDKSRSHMHAHDAEEHRRGRRDRNPEDNDALIGQERPASSANPSGSIAVIHTSLHRWMPTSLIVPHGRDRKAIDTITIARARRRGRDL
jgi:hypothetical protein